MYKRIISSIILAGTIMTSPTFASSDAKINQSNNLYDIDLRFSHDDEKTAQLFAKASELKDGDVCYQKESRSYPTHQETERAKAVRFTLMANCLEK